MEPFVKVFGNITVDKIALLIAAIFFLWKIYKKVEDYFSKRALSEAEREKKIQRIIFCVYIFKNISVCTHCFFFKF